MREGQRSRTAEAAAAVRAGHLLYDDPVIFADPFAIRLTSVVWRLIGSSRILHWLVARKLLAALLPVRGEILGRSRYAEDQLEKAVAAGVDQYVMIGAGLDSFALRRRDLLTTVNVYELDHPASQASKRDRLRRLGVDLPSNLEFISVDFERETVAQALAKSSYSQKRPAFFSWLGVVSYLERKSVFDTLRSIVGCSFPGSGLVLDYGISIELLGPADRSTVQKLRNFTARRGERLISQFDPGTFPQEVCALGFELIENLSPTDQAARYFTGRTDDLRPLASAYFVHFRVS